MHFKRPALGMDKVMSDYIYVCEFNYSGVPSQPGTPTGNLTIKQFRDIATSNGMRLEDIETRMMVGMLSTIKYASFNSRSAVGTTEYSEANQYDWANCEFDGYKDTITNTTSIKVMGLIDWYGKVWEVLANAVTTDNTLYINECKDIDDFPAVANLATTGWVNTGNVIPAVASGCYFSRFHNNPTYPYLLTPSDTNGSIDGIIGDAMWLGSYYQCVITGGRCGGSYGTNYRVGSFTFESIESTTIPGGSAGARFIV